MNPTPVHGPTTRYETRHLPLVLYDRLWALKRKLRTSMEDVVNQAIAAGIGDVERKAK